MVSKNKRELRTYIRNSTLLGVSLKEIYEELKSVHGNVAVSMSTICRWMKKFKSGNLSVENAPYWATEGSDDENECGCCEVDGYRICSIYCVGHSKVSRDVIGDGP